MDAQVAAQAAKATKDKDVKREEANERRRLDYSFKRYGAAGKPVIDKVATHEKQLEEKNRKLREKRSFEKYGEAGKPVHDKVAARVAVDNKRRDEKNRKLRVKYNLEKYGEAGKHKQQDHHSLETCDEADKPLIDKVAKRVATNKKKREDRRIKTEAKRAAEDAKPRDAEGMKRWKRNKSKRERRSRINTTAMGFIHTVLAPDISPDV